MQLYKMLFIHGGGEELFGKYTKYKILAHSHHHHIGVVVVVVVVEREVINNECSLCVNARRRVVGDVCGCVEPN